MSSASLKIAVKDHLGKSRDLATALQRFGHRLVGGDEPADVLLIDSDVPIFGYRKLIDRYKEQGATVLLYPHGANPQVGYDGLYEPYEAVDGHLVIGPGHAEVLRRLECPVPAHVIGWSMCQPAPFRPCSDIRHVVYAPSHPSGFGTIGDDAREANAATYARLLEGPWRLTVRLVGSLEQNGLWAADGVEYVHGRFEINCTEIDAADVVVAAPGTYPALSIARGAPMVLSGQPRDFDGELYYGLPDETPVPRARPERYRDYIRYPFDVTDGPLDEVLHAAARSEAPIADYRRRFIGEPLDGRGVARLISRLVAEPAPAPAPAIDETRSLTVTAMADEVSERPELLAAYARSFGPQDDASLVLWGPGLDEAALLSQVQGAITAAGLDEAALPDILLLPLPASAAVDRALAERSDARLGEWPAAGRLGELPAYGAQDAGELRSLTSMPLSSSATLVSST